MDPYSLEYLYLVQQSKRMSLSASISRLRPRYFLISPLIVAIVAVKLVDLWIADQIVRSLINKRDLMLHPSTGKPSAVEHSLDLVPIHTLVRDHHHRSAVAACHSSEADIAPSPIATHHPVSNVAQAHAAIEIWQASRRVQRMMARLDVAFC